MTTVQEKMLAQIDARLAKHGLEAVRHFSFSNIGTLYVQRRSEVHTLFRIEVKFDGKLSACIVLEGETYDCFYIVRDAHHGEHRERSFWLEYHKGHDIDGFLNCIEAQCPPLRKPPHERERAQQPRPDFKGSY